VNEVLKAEEKQRREKGFEVAPFMEKRGYLQGDTSGTREKERVNQRSKVYFRRDEFLVWLLKLMKTI
jgi:hypothetical protein